MVKLIATVATTVVVTAGIFVAALTNNTPDDVSIKPSPGVTGEQLVGAAVKHRSCGYHCNPGGSDATPVAPSERVEIQQAGRTNVHSGGRHNPRHGGGRHGGSFGSRCGCV